MFPIGAKVIRTYEMIKASYWFYPAVMALAAVILSAILPELDKYVGDEWIKKLNWFQINQPEGARAVLSTISGSMITVASVTFSMTITAMAFATGQIGPRLMNNFMRDRINQITLGTFIATFLYCLLILRNITSSNEAENSANLIEAFVPHIAILFALFLSLSSVGLLILYIHHIPESINISNIISNIGKRLIGDIDNLFPRELEEDFNARSVMKNPIILDRFTEDSIPIKCNATGYLQVLNEEGLKNLATEHDLRIKLQYRPGNYAIEGDHLMRIAPEVKVTDQIKKQALSCFAFGQERTQTQDILFLSDQLVEIVGRALSPGVNDPFTAISAMDWFYKAVVEMSERQIPGPYFYDEKENLRVIAQSITFERFCSSIFSKILPYVATDRNAALYNMKILGQACFRIEDEEKRKIILFHAEELKNSASEALMLEADRSAIEIRYQTILACLEDPAKLEAYYNDSSWVGGSA